MSIENRKAYTVFVEVRSMVMEVVGMTRVQAWTSQRVVVEENKNVVTREVESNRRFSAGCDSFRHGALRNFERAASGLRKFIKQELSGPDWSSNPLNKKRGVVSLTPTSRPLPLMADVKREVVVAEHRSGIGVGLSSTTRNAYEDLQISMRYVCMVYKFLFQRKGKGVE